jgi:hypothetical protein
MKEMASLSIIESNGNLRDKKETCIFQENHVLPKLYYGRKIQKNGLQSWAGVKKITRSSPERSEKEDQIAGNIHGSATLGTGATCQTLPLYSDVQKRRRFASCDERLQAILSVRRRRRSQSFRFHSFHMIFSASLPCSNPSYYVLDIAILSYLFASHSVSQADSSDCPQHPHFRCP